LRGISELEKRLLDKPDTIFAGTDEVGRGCLAGPVVAAAVIWDYGSHAAGIKDSKLLSKSKRRELFSYILSKARAVAVGWASPAEIDMINILQASQLAMARAVRGLDISPGILLVDGNRKVSGIDMEQITIVGGDRIVLCISAASIVAKVVRDNLMIYLDGIFPGYGFRGNMGYPTREHKEAIARLGPTNLHRKKFKGVKEFLSDEFSVGFLHDKSTVD
jgi:ribonuclease HII